MMDVISIFFALVGVLFIFAGAIVLKFSKKAGTKVKKHWETNTQFWHKYTPKHPGSMVPVESFFIIGISLMIVGLIIFYLVFFK